MEEVINGPQASLLNWKGRAMAFKLTSTRGSTVLPWIVSIQLAHKVALFKQNKL